MHSVVMQGYAFEEYSLYFLDLSRRVSVGKFEQKSRNFEWKSRVFYEILLET